MGSCLPIEIWEKIFGYLDPSDRLIASEVCTAWYEASLQPALWKDLSLSIENSIERASIALGNTRKPIQHVVIKDVDLTAGFEFWKSISTKIISLEIVQTYMSEANLLNLIIPCTNLEILHFHDCRDTFITGKLFYNPLVLDHVKKSLPKLKEICFSDNGSYLSDAMIDRFMSITSNLKSLGFAGTSVSFHPGIHKRFYSQSSNNQENCKSSELVLTFDCISDHIKRNSGTIKHLDFSNTLINDKSCLLLSQIDNLKLQSLLLRSCEVSHAGINALCANQTSITELDLSFCGRITDTALESIASNLKHLQKLSLQSCRAVTDVGISSLKQLLNLFDLNIQGLERVTTEGIEFGLLSSVNTNLRRLNLSATNISEETLYKLADFAPYLSYLNLSSCVKAVSDAGLRALWKSLDHLTYLKLDWCSNLTDSGLLTLQPEASADSLTFESSERCTHSISTLEKLKHLSLSGCNKISDKSLSQALCFKDIRHLDLNACSMITDEGLIRLTHNNPRLEVLVLNYCSKLSDNGLTIVLGNVPRLKRLELHGCLKLTASIFTTIEKKLRYISYLDISHCKLISLESALLFHSRMPSLKIFLTSGIE